MTKSKQIMHSSHNVSRKEKYLLLIELLPENQIISLLESHHSYGMIKDLLSRDFVNNETNEIIKKIICSKGHQTFANILKSKGLFFDLKAYNLMPQYWKIQYRFPKNYTTEQIKEEIKKSSSEGQKKTVDNRKINGSYLNQPFLKKWSPFTVDFYVNKGWSREAAQKRIKSICSKGALSALTKTQSPKTEDKIEVWLKELGYVYSKQLSIINDGLKDKRRRFVFDFFIPSANLLIEVNGDYFHANPLFYNENDALHHPGTNGILAKEIWQRDKNKVDYAIALGYNILVIWEQEINYKPQEIKERLKNAEFC